MNWNIDLKEYAEYMWNQQKNKVPKENDCQPRIVNPTKILLKKKNKTKTFPNK